MNDDQTFKKIKKVLDFIWKNPYSSFYRDKYKKAGINLVKDINSIEDFKKLPYLTREEIVKADPFDRFFLPLDKFKSFNISSGSSGSERLIMLRADLKNYSFKKLSHKAQELGVKSCMFFNSPTAFRQLDAVPDFQCKNINRYLGDIYKMPLTAKLVSKLKVNAFSVAPSYLNLALPYLEKECDLKKIKYIALGGEYCSYQRLLYFKRKFPNAYIRRKYATTEAGGVGKRCIFLDKESPQVFHPLPNLYFEFLNPHEESELILTHLDTQREFPLIRYKTGDIVRKIEENCQCRKKEKIKIFGRINTDVFRIRDLYLYPEEIDGVIVSLEKYLDISNWKLYIFNKKLPKLKFQVIPKKGVKNIDSFVKDKLMQNLYFGSGDKLEDMIRKKIFAPIEVEFVESIEFNPPKTRNIIYYNE